MYFDYRHNVPDNFFFGSILNKRFLRREVLKVNLEEVAQKTYEAVDDCPSSSPFCKCFEDKVNIICIYSNRNVRLSSLCSKPLNHVIALRSRQERYMT